MQTPPISWIIAAMISTFLIYPQKKQAQSIESGDLFSEISSIIANLPATNGGNQYADPSALQISEWNTLLSQLVSHNYSSAATTANNIGYELVAYTDNASSQTYYMLRANAANHWGTYIYNPNYCRPLVLQAPHPRKDFNTGKQAIHCFLENNALFFCMAGTHRCNHASMNNCSGTTQTCNATGDTNSYKFRISDMAHSDVSIFQHTSTHLFNHFNDAYFLSLHGFTKKTTDPYVILSNGTLLTPTLDYLDILDDMLLAQDNSLSFKIAHIDNWTRLMGSTNTQGRMINGSNNACSTAATNTNGRFLHIEQEKNKLRADITGWNKMSNALQQTFSCTPLALASLHFEVALNAQANLQFEWTSIQEKDNDYFEIEYSQQAQNWLSLARVYSQGNSDTEQHYTHQCALPINNPKSYYRLKIVDQDGLISYSDIRQINQLVPTTKLYPNPANHYIDIQSNKQSFSLFNSLGQRIKAPNTSTIQKGTQRLYIDHLQSGWYFIRVDGQFYSFFKL